MIYFLYVKRLSCAPGLGVIVEPGPKGTVHIPVIITATGLSDLVYNTIEIGAGAEILLVAGCGIHNPGHAEARHDGIHEIFVRRGAVLHYQEKQYGESEGKGKRVLNPKTALLVEEDAYAELELIQIRGVDDTIRDTQARVEAGGRLAMPVSPFEERYLSRPTFSRPRLCFSLR